LLFCFRLGLSRITQATVKTWWRLYSLERASRGALVPLNHANVPVTCTRLCLKDLVPIQWKHRYNRKCIQSCPRAAIFATLPTFRGTRHGLHVSGKWIVVDCFAILLSQQQCQRNSRLWVDDASSVFLRASFFDAVSQTTTTTRPTAVRSRYV